MRARQAWIGAVIAGGCLSTACGPAGEGAAPDAALELDSAGDSSSPVGGPIDGGAGGGSNEGSTGGGAADGSGGATIDVAAGTSDGGGRGDAGSGEGPLPGGAMAFPAPGRQGICPDPPLRITFAGAPALGTSGKITVASAAGAVAATVDMGATSFSDVIGGITFNTVRPVYVDGNDVVVYLKSRALTYGQTYYVNVDPGAIVAPMGEMPDVPSDFSQAGDQESFGQRRQIPNGASA